MPYFVTAVCTAFRMAGADLRQEYEQTMRDVDHEVTRSTYLECAFANPWWTLMEELRPGKRVGLRLSRVASPSVNSDTLWYSQLVVRATIKDGATYMLLVFVPWCETTIVFSDGSYPTNPGVRDPSLVSTT